MQLLKMLSSLVILLPRRWRGLTHRAVPRQDPAGLCQGTQASAPVTTAVSDETKPLHRIGIGGDSIWVSPADDGVMITIINADCSQTVMVPDYDIDRVVCALRAAEDFETPRTASFVFMHGTTLWVREHRSIQRRWLTIAAATPKTYTKRRHPYIAIELRVATELAELIATCATKLTVNWTKKPCTIQLFSDKVMHDCVTKLEKAGYIVQRVPSDGSTMLWINDYQVIGRKAVTEFVDYLVWLTPGTPRPA